jgi:hypothetical protein
MSDGATPDPRTDHPSFFCADCDVATYVNQQYFMLHDELWARVAPKSGAMLCLSCVEVRLRRPLDERDFASVPLNELQARVCPEPFVRLHRKT